MPDACCRMPFLPFSSPLPTTHSQLPHSPLFLDAKLCTPASARVDLPCACAIFARRHTATRITPMFSREPKPLRQPPAAPNNTTETHSATLPVPAAVTSTNEEPCTAAPRPVDRRLLLGLTGLTGLAVAARIAKAGPLNPPPGPIQPTGKPLSEIEPRIPLSMKDANPRPTEPLFRITRNGSYYLTEDLVTFDDRSIIGIAASSITLDLNGFTIGRPVRATYGDSSYGIAGFARMLHIRNGTIKGCSRAAIQVSANAGRISNIIASENGYGMSIEGPIAVEHCVSSLNDSTGFSGDSGTTFHACIADANAHTGFNVYDGHVHSCTARNNRAWGMHLFSTHARDCDVTHNGWGGIRAEFECMILDSLAQNNFGDVVVGSAMRSGFEIVGPDNRIERCTAIGNAYGFSFLGANARGNFVACNYATQNNRLGSSNNYNIPNPAANPAIGPIITNLAQATNPFANIEG